MATSLSPAARETRGDGTAAAFGGGSWGEEERGKKRLFEGIWGVLKETTKYSGGSDTCGRSEFAP